jgi:hypothetical protein
MLSGPEILLWTDAFYRAFSSREFSDLLRYRLDERLDAYASENDPLKDAIADVIDAYQRRDEEDVLISAAVESRPRNEALLRLAQKKRATADFDEQGLQVLIRETNSFLNISQWLDKVGGLQVRVCRIEIAASGGGQRFGTGFLIGPDLVMTNWHVVYPLLTSEERNATNGGPMVAPGGLVCRFDYKVLANGTTNPGNTFQLAADWKVLLSPNSKVGREPQADELDIAIVRLREPAGSLPVGKPGAKGSNRGWISLGSGSPNGAFKEHAPLFIIQHPSAEPLKLALDTDAILNENANKTRVRYATNTEPGSSGSPCFDQQWNFIAVHHSGDPGSPDHRPGYNEGIPAPAIVSHLATKGLTLAPFAE